MPKITLPADVLGDLPQVCVATGEREDLAKARFKFAWKNFSLWSILTMFLGFAVTKESELTLYVPLAKSVRRSLARGLAFAICLGGLSVAVFARAVFVLADKGLQLKPIVGLFSVSLALMACAWCLPRVQRWRILRLSPDGDGKVTVKFPSEAAAAIWRAALTPPAAPAAGVGFGSKYVNLRQIGAEGGVTIYQATHADLGVEVTLRVLSPELSRREEVAAAFVERAEELVRQGKRLHDMGTEDGCLYVTGSQDLGPWPDFLA